MTRTVRTLICFGCEFRLRCVNLGVRLSAFVFFFFFRVCCFVVFCLILSLGQFIERRGTRSVEQTGTTHARWHAHSTHATGTALGFHHFHHVFGIHRLHDPRGSRHGRRPGFLVFQQVGHARHRSHHRFHHGIGEYHLSGFFQFFRIVHVFRKHRRVGQFLHHFHRLGHVRHAAAGTSSHATGHHLGNHVVESTGTPHALHHVREAIGGSIGSRRRGGRRRRRFLLGGRRRFFGRHAVQLVALGDPGLRQTGIGTAPLAVVEDLALLGGWDPALFLEAFLEFRQGSHVVDLVFFPLEGDLDVRNGCGCRGRSHAYDGGADAQF
mmetsp:Transcript_16922/g.38867  ORF Transcript_16922/g.38867 Transcript_16922/m.38867 type:complete len:323 (+) Transcript_16922:219-1187(+)